MNEVTVYIASCCQCSYITVLASRVYYRTVRYAAVVTDDVISQGCAFTAHHIVSISNNVIIPQPVVSTTELSRNPAVITDDAVVKSKTQSQSAAHHVISVSNLSLVDQKADIGGLNRIQKFFSILSVAFGCVIRSRL